MICENEWLQGLRERGDESEDDVEGEDLREMQVWLARKIEGKRKKRLKPIDQRRHSESRSSALKKEEKKKKILFRLL